MTEAPTETKSAPLPFAVKLGAMIAMLACVLILAGAAIWWTRSGSDTGPLSEKKLAAIHEAAQHYILSDKIPQAKAIVAKLLQRAPDDAQAHVLMAKILMTEGKGDDAYDQVMQSLKLQPNDDQVQFLAGAMAETGGALDKARYHYARASTLAPRNGVYPMHLGEVMIKTGDLDGAQLQLLRAKSLNASLTQVYAMLAEIASRQGKLTLALDEIDKAIDQSNPHDPHWVPYLLEKAQLLRRANHPDAALALLLTLAPGDQQQPAVVQQISACYLMLGKPSRAAAVWMELFALDPQNQDAAAQAGLCFLRAGDREHARQYLDFAKQFGDKNPNVQALESALASPAKPPQKKHGAQSPSAGSATRR